jgi:hypothetical protein
MSSGLNLSVQECAIQLFYELYKFFRVPLAAGCFGKYSPISHLGFHWFTSVALFNLPRINACAVPTNTLPLFCMGYDSLVQTEPFSIR